MKRIAIILIALLAYAGVMIPFSSYMQNKPFVEKLGYVPSASVLRAASLDQQQLVASSLVMKVLIYYGSIFEAYTNRVKAPLNYEGMVRMIESAVKLDPYNMDGYYFTQAVLSWEHRDIERANALLDYGMQYRDWDFYLPYFAGFNAAYFQKDYDKAAMYFKRAADLTGFDLFTRLAGRYMYESGKTELAISFMKTMLESTRDEAIRKNFKMRLQALEEVRRGELAVAGFRNKNGFSPKDLADLIASGDLAAPLVDPYGGDFYLDEKSQVRTTSQFSIAGAKKRGN